MKHLKFVPKSIEKIVVTTRVFYKTVNLIHFVPTIKESHKVDVLVV